MIIIMAFERVTRVRNITKQGDEMSKKKKRIIIIAIVLLLCIAVTTTVVLITRNSGRKQENQLADNEDIHTEEQTDDISISHDTSENVTLSSNSTEGKTESAEESTTEEAKEPTTESGSTADDNKPTGEISGSTTSQPTMTQTTTQTSTTQTPTTQAPTTQSPNTTEQPVGGNQGGGNGGNTHQHTWEAQYRTVHHDEEGHWEEVVKEAYDEPVYVTHQFCNYCGIDITASGQDVGEHCIPCGYPLSEDDPRYIPGVITTSGSSYGTKDVQVGTIHHEAVYDKKWIVDKKAYDE